jgi:hypothetical protein
MNEQIINFLTALGFLALLFIITLMFYGIYKLIVFIFTKKKEPVYELPEDYTLIYNETTNQWAFDCDYIKKSDKQYSYNSKIDAIKQAIQLKEAIEFDKANKDINNWKEVEQ